MKNLYVLTGPAGVGKSTWVKEQDKINSIVLSSDAIRAELYGEENNGANGPEVMRILNERLDEAVNNPSIEHIYFDRTNLLRKHRKPLFQKYKKKVHIINVFFYKPVETILLQNKKRFHVVPEERVREMYLKTEVPRVDLDCHEIIVVNEFSEFKEEINKNFKKSHANRFHTETIEEHINECVRNAEKSESQDREILIEIAKYHDLGKSIARHPVYETKDPLKEAVLNHFGEYYQYMGHENVSAAYYLCHIGNKVNTEEKSANILEAIFLHDRMFSAEKDVFMKKYNISGELYRIMEEFRRIDSMSIVPFKY